MNVFIDGIEKLHISIIKNLLLPWKINYTNSEKAELIISCHKMNEYEKPTIIIPTNNSLFKKFIKKINNYISFDDDRKFNVFVSSDFFLEIIPKSDNVFIIPNNGITNEEKLLMINIHDDICMIPFDIFYECQYIVNNVLKPNVSDIYSLIMKFPVPYNIVPSNIRNYIFKFKSEKNDIVFNKHLSFDAIRFLLKNFIEKLLKKSLIKKIVKKNEHNCLFTHDIESKQGLINSLKLKKLEEQYDIRSTWFIPSNKYELIPNIINSLSNYGEIGIHGFRHNGRLYRLSDDDMLSNLREAKEKLKNIIGREILGFRSPLLQFNSKICNNLKKTQFLYDSSIPTWEPKNPLTMKPHGIETVFPLILNKLIEIPVSVPQDYHMLKVLNYSLEETVTRWLTINDQIKKMGGLSTFLVHPDYDFAKNENLVYYEELLSRITSDKDAHIVNTNEIIDQVIKNDA